MTGPGYHRGISRTDNRSCRHSVDLERGIQELADPAGLRLHDLRHSFASFAIADGQSLFMVAKLLAHKQTRTNERYAHLADDPLRTVAERFGVKMDLLERSNKVASSRPLPVAK